jgi:hypothetical protein
MPRPCKGAARGLGMAGGLRRGSVLTSTPGSGIFLKYRFINGLSVLGHGRFEVVLRKARIAPISLPRKR